jgi:hypothetical protein
VNKRSLFNIAGLLIVLSLLLAACQPQATPTAEPTAAVVEPTDAPEPTAVPEATMAPEPTA